MKRAMISVLFIVPFIVACAGPFPSPTPTPNEYNLLKAYLEDAKALVDKNKEISDAAYKQVHFCDKDEAGSTTYSVECRKVWQELAIREYAVYLEFQSQWQALNPPSMAHSYHAQMALSIEKHLDYYITLQAAPTLSEVAFNEVFMDAYDTMMAALVHQAEADRTFEILWKMAIEGER